MKRREFLTKGLATGVAAGVAPSAVADADWSALDETVSLGFIGIGGRGSNLLDITLDLPGVEISAVCDIAEQNLRDAQDVVEQSGQPRPAGYGEHDYSYREMLEEEDLDGVVIATSWEWHLQMAVDAMKAGTYAAFEVGPANSVEECWELVETYEETGVPSMLLENSCFSRNNMMVLNMVRQGLFGELIHCKCGYLHDLQGRLVLGKGTGPNPLSSSNEVVKGEGDYRSMHNQFRNGDLYPTHGVGPIAKCLEVNRGNRFSSLTSTATKTRGLEDWSEENLSADHPQRDVDWKRGDVVTTTIKCQNGETVVLTFDTVLPRPRGKSVRLIQGVEGIWEHEKDAVHIDGRSPEHEWESMDNYRDEFEHPLWERYLQDDQMPKTGHGGRDSLELRVFVESVRHGSPPPIDVYDAAAWRAIAPLSEASIAKGSQPVEFPDFTDGQWMSNDPIFGVSDEYSLPHS